MFVNAPAGDAVKPVPFNVSGLAVVSVKPLKSKTAPELTVVAVDVPSAVVEPNFSVPAVTDVAPA